MIEATVALPVRGPEGAYRVSRSANSLEAAAPTVIRPRAAQPAPAATVAATMPPLGWVWLACIMRLLEGRDRRRCRRRGGGRRARAARWPRPGEWPARRPRRRRGRGRPRHAGGGGPAGRARAGRTRAGV